jgi:hypothetical protein
LSALQTRPSDWGAFPRPKIDNVQRRRRLGLRASELGDAFGDLANRKRADRKIGVIHPLEPGGDILVRRCLAEFAQDVRVEKIFHPRGLVSGIVECFQSGTLQGPLDAGARIGPACLGISIRIGLGRFDLIA